MHQLQANKAKPSHQPGARRETQQRPAPIAGHDRWMALQRGVGNQAVSRLLQNRAASAPPTATPASALRINEPGDAFEQEADRVATQVMQMPAAEQAPSAPPRIGSQAAIAGGAAKVQTKSAAPAGPRQAPASVHTALSSPGRPLDASSRAFFEPRLGRDLSSVRVHAGGTAERSAGDINASAYTVGSHIVFGAGHFAPESTAGRRLLAHELTHVVQNASAPVADVLRRNPDPPPEAPAKIISPVWNVEGHAVVVVEFSGRKKAFYQRTDDSPRPEGHRGPKIGDWAPFDGWSPKTNSPGEGHFDKNSYYDKIDPKHADYGYGNPKNKEVGDWLKQQGFQRPSAEHQWTEVQAELEQRGVFVRSPLSRKSRGGGGSGGAGGGGSPPPAQENAQQQSEQKPPPKQTTQEQANEPSAQKPAEPPGGQRTQGQKPPSKGAISNTDISPGAFESSAGAGQEATANAVGGAAVMIHQGQVQNLENYEQQKAEDAFKKIEPTVNRLTAQGSWVAVKFYFDAPKAPNLLSGVFKEQSDISRFLWISYNTGDTKEEALGTAPAKMDVNYDYNEYDAPKDPLGADRTGTVSEVRVFPPDPQPAQPVMMGHPSFVGNFSTDHVDQSSVGGRFDEMVATGMHRSLQFHAGSAAAPRSVVEMWHVDSGGTKHRYSTESVSGNDPSKGISARFTEKVDGKVYYTINSFFSYVYNPYGDNILVESVSGEQNTSPGLYNWSAAIVWKQNDKTG